MVLVVLTDIVPLRQRPKYTSYVQVTLAFGTISGPLIGGAIVQHLTWRWLFYLSFPFCGIGLALIPFVVKLKKQKTTFINMFLHVDWLGSFLFIGSTTSFLIAITWGGGTIPVGELPNPCFFTDWNCRVRCDGFLGEMGCQISVRPPLHIRGSISLRCLFLCHDTGPSSTYYRLPRHASPLGLLLNKLTARLSALC